MNIDELRKHLDRMASASSVVALPDLLDEQEVSCVDGRKADGVVGAPGGNAGLFVLMLAALEAHAGEPIAGEHVSDLLAEYLDEFGRFYMHTDDLALGRLEVELEKQSDGLRLPQVSVEALIREPPSDVQPLLLELLLDPDHVGCGHLMLMLKYPGQYGVRRQLVQSVLRAYFRRLWDGDGRLVFDVLEGAHDEKAVVTVHVEEGSDVALAAPRYADTDVFVYHPEAAHYFQRKNAAFLARREVIDEDGTSRFEEVQKAIAGEQLAATLRHLAPTLPVFEATFRVRDGRVECAGVRRAE